MNYVLGIETSCDDTSVSIIDKNGNVHFLSSLNQDLMHGPFGGIVPEIASRNHTLKIMPLIDIAFKKTNLSFDQISLIAATNRPGLLGSLLVGVSCAKALSLSLRKPWIGVHHIEGHILSPFLRDDGSQNCSLDFPYISLVVSGGHTSIFLVKKVGEYQLLGSTIDDAAGEAFDKFAKMLGLGYPGGVQIDKLSKAGDPNFHPFPRALLESKNFDFSFSGLKTAAQNFLKKMSQSEIDKEINNLCASYQEAIVDVLIEKTFLAARSFNVKNIAICGGVSANSRLREKSLLKSKKEGVHLAIPPLKFCTDNASMIAYAGLKRFELGEVSTLEEGIFARASL